MTHDEIEELLGAYALDALDEDERQEIDDHLVTCPRCRAEVAAHREVTALLGNVSGDVPAGAPDHLWDRISASLQEEPPVLAPVARPRSWRRFAVIVPLGAVAAGLILTVGLLAAKVSNLNQQVTSLGAGQGVSSVILNPAHKTVELNSANARWRTEAVVLPSGQGYLIDPSMPAIGSSKTFQLWALSNGKVVSLGVLGPRPDGVPIRVEPTMTLLMITAEPLGGTPVPTTPVLVQGHLPVGL
jgi:anti-sigma-K factor RskA